MNLSLPALKASRALWRHREKSLSGKLKHARDMLKRRDEQIAKASVRLLWHPDATRMPLGNAGDFVSAPARGVLHTTDSSAFPVYRQGTAPHFTLNPVTGDLWQHTPLNQASMSLEHPSGTLDTNRMHAIQVEMIGFATNTPQWSEQNLRHVADLMRWIERNAGVQRTCSVEFSTIPRRMTDDQWRSYNGWCGHQHVPHQPSNHWDPGRLAIGKLLA